MALEYIKFLHTWCRLRRDSQDHLPLYCRAWSVRQVHTQGMLIHLTSAVKVDLHVIFRWFEAPHYL